MNDKRTAPPDTALLIVDVQNGFICPSTSHIPALVEKLQYGYQTVIVTQFYNQRDSFFRSLIKWDRVQADTEEFNLAFTPKDDAWRVTKPFYSCVTPDFLNDLNRYSIKSMDICGIDTDICVLKCAVDLFENEIEPIVLKDYCSSTGGEDAHACGLRILERFIGSDQIRSNP